MSREGLVPVMVTDVNGVQTTRWKRPDRKILGAKDMPLPQIKQNVDRNDFPMALMIEDQSEEFLNSVNYDSLRKLDAYLHRSPKKREDIIKNCVSMESSASLNNMGAFINVMDDMPKEAFDYYAQSVFGLQWRHVYDDADYSSLEGIEKERMDAVIKVTMTFGQPFSITYNDPYAKDKPKQRYIPLQGVTKLVMKHYNKIDQMKALIINRKFDASDKSMSQLDELLEEDVAAPLTEGLL